jgi:hypothetical protein
MLQCPYCSETRYFSTNASYRVHKCRYHREAARNAAIAENQQAVAQQAPPQQLPEDVRLEGDKAEVIKMLMELASRECRSPALNPGWSKWITDYFNFVFSLPADQRLIEMAKLRSEYDKSPGTRLIELSREMLTRMLQDAGRRKTGAEEAPAANGGQNSTSNQNEGRGQSYLI